MLIGHKKIWERLIAQVKSGTLGHAQLFIGPQHVGKTKLAVLLAMQMQCKDEHDVITKRQIASGQDPDTHLYLDDGEVFKIETVRDIIKKSGHTSLKENLIFIIENIGRMKAEAVNALLKTLEEPRKNTYFFLTANKEEDVMDTVRSRCSVTYFHTVGKKEMQEACRENVYEEELLAFSVGRPGKLKRMLDDDEYFQLHREMQKEINYFFENLSPADVYTLVRKYEKSEYLAELLDIMLQTARRFALSTHVAPTLRHISFPDALEQIEEVKRDLDLNINIKLLLENLLLPFVP